MSRIRFSDVVSTNEDDVYGVMELDGGGGGVPGPGPVPGIDPMGDPFVPPPARRAFRSTGSVASDTSSAAGFGSHHTRSSLSRMNGIDDGGGLVDEFDLFQYRPSDGIHNMVAGSPAYSSQSSYRAPILKNGGGGTLPRSHSRTSTGGYGSMMSPRMGVSMGNGGGMLPRHNSATDFGGPMQTPNGIIRNQPSRPAPVNGSLLRKPNAHRSNAANNNKLMSGPPSMVDRELDYPAMPKPSSNGVITAVATKPCCECNCFKRDTGGGPQQTPICLLFTIFLAFSLLLVSGVMLYLRGGTN